MARKVVETVVSDLSGDQVADGQAWVMRLEPDDKRKNVVVLDITEEEAREFARKGREVKRRGRRPGSRNRPQQS